MGINIYTVRTVKGLVFHVQARSRHEAAQRATSPAVTRTILSALADELAQITTVELHRGPAHVAQRKLFFDDAFKPGYPDLAVFCAL